MKTVDDVRAEMARLYREAKSGARPVADASRLSYMLSQLAQLIETADFEGRLAEALEAAERREKEGRGKWSRPH